MKDAMRKSASKPAGKVIRPAMSIVKPDPTFPDVIIIPRETANDVASLTACIDAQRIGRELVSEKIGGLFDENEKGAEVSRVAAVRT